MDSFERFNEKKLPPMRALYSSLKGEGITEKEYLRAKLVWKKNR